MLSLSLTPVDPSLTYCLRSLPIYKTKEGVMPRWNMYDISEKSFVCPGRSGSVGDRCCGFCGYMSQVGIYCTDRERKEGHHAEV